MRDHLTRAKLIKELNSRGYPINHSDVNWALEVGLISPKRIHEQLFAYGDEEIEWLSRLGELKQLGFDRTVIDKIYRMKAMDLIQELVMRLETMNWEQNL